MVNDRGKWVARLGTGTDSQRWRITDLLRIGLLGPHQLADGVGRAAQVSPGEPPAHPGDALLTLVSRLRAELRRPGLTR